MSINLIARFHPVKQEDVYCAAYTSVPLQSWDVYVSAATRISATESKAVIYAYFQDEYILVPIVQLKILNCFVDVKHYTAGKL